MNCRLPQAKLYHIWRELWRHTRRQSSPLLEASSSRIFTGQKEACSTQTSTQTLPKAISLPKPKSSYPIPSKPRNPQILHPATARPARSVTPHTRRRDHHGIKIQCTGHTRRLVLTSILPSCLNLAFASPGKETYGLR